MQTATRGEFIRKYIRTTRAEMSSQAQGSGYYALPEPVTALFGTKARVQTLGLLNPEDVLRAEIKSQVEIHWRKEARENIAKIRAHVPNLIDIMRGGGPYPPYATKRIGRWVRHETELINETWKFWDTDFWRSFGRPKFQSLLQVQLMKTLDNLTRIEADPELIIGDKEPNTGTGWAYPLNTRYEASRNIRGFIPRIKDSVEHYMHDYQDAIQEWPEKDVLWYVNTSMYKGIFGGVRSDPTFTKWEDIEGGAGAIINITCSAREVGNTPESSWHNKKLNDKSWRRQMWQDYSSPMHMMPHNIDTYVEVLTTPLVTQVDDGEYGLFSIDFGFVDPPATFEKTGGKWHLRQPNERVKLGADNIVLAGLFTETAAGRWIAHLKSGESITATQYLVTIGWMLYQVLKELGITARIAEIGDDVHLIMKPEDVPALLAAVGPWMRTKGMTDTTNFIWGHHLVWKDKDHVASFVSPRALKTMTSPIMKKSLKQMKPVEVGPWMYVRSDVQDAIGQFYQMYGDMVYFEGTRDEYRMALQTRFQPSAEVLVQQGVSEWMEYYLH